MKGLLNLLAVLATLLSLTTGCGLRGGGNGGQGLLRLGQVLRSGHLATGGAGGVLATAMGAALGGGTRGRLLSGLTTAQTGSLAGALASGAVGLGSNSGTSGLEAGLGVLGGRLGGGTRQDLLVGLGKLAAARLGAGSSSAVVGSGSSVGISGQQLQQGLLQSGQVAAGYLMAASATSNTATGMRTQLAGSTVTNTVSAIANQASGAPVTVLPSGGSRPSLGGVIPGGSPLQGLGQGAQHMGQAMSRQSLLTTSTVTQSLSGFGTQRAGNPGTYPQGTIQSHPGGSPISGPTIGNSGPGSNGVGAGLGRGQEGLGALSTSGTSGDLSGVLGTTARGVHQGPGVLQGVQRTSQVVGAGVLQTSHAVANAAEGFGANLISNTISNTQGRVPGQGDGVSFNGATNGGSRMGSDGIQSGLGRGQGPQGAVYGADGLGGLQNGRGDLSAGRPHGAGPSTGAPVSGTGILAGQGLAQGTNQIGQGLGGAPTDRGSALLLSTGGITTQMTRHSETTSLNVASGIGGATGSAAPGGVMEQGASEPVSGARVTAVRGLLQNTHQIGQTLGGRTNGNRGGILQSTAGLATHTAGSTVATALNVATSLAGVPSGAAPGTGYGPGSSAPGPGSNLLQGAGRGAPQVGVPLGGTLIGSSGAAQQSTTSIGTQMSGGFPGGSPGEGPAQGTEPMSQGPGGMTHMTVSTSSHSASSWRSQTHVIRGSAVNSMGGLPSLAGNGPNDGAPSGGSGFSATGTNSGTNLLGAIVTASTGGHPVGVPATVPSPAVGGIVSSGASVPVPNSAISGISQHTQIQRRRKIDGATVAGIALGSVASAIALGAIGAGIAGAINSGTGNGGRTINGCGGGCPRRCGRKRRSVSQSKVPAEVLNSVPMDFNRL